MYAKICNVFRIIHRIIIKKYKSKIYSVFSLQKVYLRLIGDVINAYQCICL